MMKRQSWQWVVMGLCLALAAAALWVFLSIPEAGLEWFYSFRAAALNWQQPYQFYFHNPPWALALIYPLALLPQYVGLVCNALLTALLVWLFIRRETPGQARNWVALLAVLLSPVFLKMVSMGNIEWIILLGLVLGGGWAVPLVLVKPQEAGLAALLFWKRSGYRWQFWLPLAGVGLASLLIWGWWPGQMMALPPNSNDWNLSFFPWSIAPGLVCVWLGWRRDQMRWLLLGNLLLTPYFSPASMLAALTAWSAKYPRVALAITAVLWIYGFILTRSW